MAAAGLMLDQVGRAAKAPRELPEGYTREQFNRWAQVDMRRLDYYIGAQPTGADVESILLEGQSFEKLQAARAHALAGLLTCPLSPEARYYLLETDFVVRDETEKKANPSIALLQQFDSMRRGYRSATSRAVRMGVVHPGPEAVVPIARRAIAADAAAAPAMWDLLAVRATLDQRLEALPTAAEPALRILERDRGLTPEARARLIAHAADALDAIVDADKRAEDHARVGRLALLESDLARAARAFESAIDLEPSSTDFRYRLAMVQEALGQWELAVENIQRCVLREPANRRFVAAEKRLMEKKNVIGASAKPEA